MRLLLWGVIFGVCCAGCNRNPAVNGKNAQAPEVSPTVVAASATLGAKISQALQREPKLKGAGIMVGISNLDGTVYLSGNAVDSAQEKLAVRLAQSHAKNAKVVSQLRLQKSNAVVNKKVQPSKDAKR